jgi:hypothetical protein
LVQIPITADPTLEAMRRACEVAGNNTREKRDYIGASAIGNPCARQIYYDYHGMPKKPFDSATLFRFDDGHRTEDLICQRLRMVEGIELWTEQDGKQFGFADFDNCFRGHVDGIIRGIRQAPKTTHVLEIKCTEDLNKFRKVKNDFGEKQALKNFNNTYFVQAQLYMHYFMLDRHYTIVASAGGRDMESCRTEFQPEVAQMYKDRAFEILNAKQEPPRISDKKDFWICRFCSFLETCHGNN